jgi:CheY-like chemotaxis protein
MIRKVLFVDDDQILQLAIEKRLSAYSDQFSIVLANDGFDALKKLAEIPVSVICMDLMMPRMDGMGLHNNVRERYPDIPIIIVSGMKEENARYLTEAEGVVGYFKKPFDTDELGKKIISILQEEASSGIMHHVSPTMFMQLMEMEGKTCTIRMIDNKNGEGGILYLLDGQLLDARVGDKTGIDAAYHVFSWDEVTVFFRNECDARENTINSELQSIIMGALAAKDELDESPFGDEEGSPVAGGGGEDLGLPMDLLEDAPEDLDQALASKKLGEDDPMAELRAFIRDELDGEGDLEAVYKDDTLDPAIEKINKVGEHSGLGKFKAGYVENEKGNGKLVIPGDSSTVYDVSPKFPVNKALKAMQNRK